MTREEQQSLIAQAEEQNKRGNYSEAEGSARTVISESCLESSVKAQALVVLSASLYQRGLAKEALVYAEEAVTVATQGRNKVEEAQAWHTIGGVYHHLSEYGKALEYYRKSLALHEEFGNHDGIAGVTGNIGNVYQYLSEYAKALEYFTAALALHEELGDRASIARVMGNIGSVYGRLSEYGKALEYFMEALALHEEFGNRAGVASVSGNIGNVYQYLSEYAKALEYFTAAVALHEELGNRAGVAAVMGNIGNVYRSLSEYAKALQYYTAALALHEDIGNRAGVANVTGNIGNVYWNLSEYAKALEYFMAALALHEDIGNRIGVANVTGNIGNVYGRLLEYEKALEYYTRALALHEELGERASIAIVTRNIGNVYLGFLEYEKALEYYTRALALHEELRDRASVARATGNIGVLYTQKGFTEYNPTKAEELLLQAIALDEELGAKQDLYENHQFLANLYQQESRWEEAYNHFKKYHELYQEVQSEEAKKKALQVEQQRQIAEMEKRTAAERARAKTTEELLHKTLPPSIADRMIAGEQHIADRFDSASILFADVVGFTPMTASMPASAVLEFMNFVFAHFDEIAAKHGCERIKTIGDGYMAVCGAPIECGDHAERIARMAMEMLEDISLPESISEHLPSGAEFEIRIGLHCGSITAGVIGTGKLAYDIYGDAVNTASRMESHGEAGKIHVSEAFAEALFGSIQASSVPSPITTHPIPLTLHTRGVLDIKGKGQLRTYFLEVT